MSQWNCLTFARDVLHLPVSKDGSRVRSLAGQKHSGNEAMVIYRDWWYDHKLHIGGSVIDLCAWSMFNGDVGRAMYYLAGDFYSVDEAEYRKEITRMQDHVKSWHEKLRREDIDYLHSRRINDETIERLQLGTMSGEFSGKLELRLVIPYFKNGQIVYYITRDRTGFQGVAKYKKCYLPRDDDKQDKEVLFNIPWGLHTLERKYKPYQSNINDAGVNKRDWLIIAEGAFDAMSFEQEDYCVLSPMCGGFTQIEQKTVTAQAKTFRNVLVIFDNDDAGSSFQKKLAKDFFLNRVNFFAGFVPSSFNGHEIKDVSDFYSLGGNLAELITSAVRGVDYLAEHLDDTAEVKEFLYKTARFTEKSDMLELMDKLKRSKHFSPFWLKTVYEEAVKAPAETVIVHELLERSTLKYLEGSGFLEYQHGVWNKIADNKVKSYADEILGRYATNSRITSAMKFAQARTTSDEEMNAQPIINLRNGVLLLNENCRFVMHAPEYLSTIQIPFNYDPKAECLQWDRFICDIVSNDCDKYWLLQEIAGYILWPNNNLERCFFLMGDGGNGKGVYMETLRDVFGSDNCSALPLSSFGTQFDPIMLQYSLVNFCSENRVDLRGNTERIKEVTSGNEIVAAHKGIDAVKFSPRCKLITSCNDFFNTGEITHALMRRLCFVKFNNNYVKMKTFDINLKEKLRQELPGILNWCIKGYLRLLKQGNFTETKENDDMKLEFMRTTNPVAYFIEETLGTAYGVRNSREIYSEFKRWCDDTGYKALSLGAFTNRIKRVMREMRPEVRQEERGNKTFFYFTNDTLSE